jgi:hypothetical protein
VDWHRFWLVLFVGLCGLGAVAAGVYGVLQRDAAGATLGFALGQFMLTLAAFTALAHRLAGRRRRWFHLLPLGLSGFVFSAFMVAGPLLDGYADADLKAIVAGGIGCVALTWAAVSRLVRHWLGGRPR